MGWHPKPTPALTDVNQTALKEYLEAVAVSVAERLRPGIPEDVVRELAAAAAQNPGLAGPALELGLTFCHVCRFLGCATNTCSLCKHNPNKRCAANDNFCQTVIEKQALRTRCDAPIEVQLRNHASGQAFKLAGLLVQLSVIDGHAYNEDAPSPAATVVKLLRSEKGSLLGCDGNGGKVLPDGHVIMDLQDGHAWLPSSLHVRITNHVLKVKSFRLLAEPVRCNEQGQYVADSTIKTAVSGRFEVKSNRAATKSAYPHHSEPFTTLKYMGSGSYKALKDVKACLGVDVPFDSVQTVGELKALIQYADAHTEVENALSELFRFKGEHRERWGELRGVLEQVVLDDNTPRVWFCDDGGTGLLFPCKQGQVIFAKPMALLQRVQEGGVVRDEVVPFEASHHQLVKSMRQVAEAAWKTQGHRGWQMVTPDTDASAAQYLNTPGRSAPMNMPGASSALLHPVTISSIAAALPLPHSAGSGSHSAGSSPPTAGGMHLVTPALQQQSCGHCNGSMRGVQPGPNGGVARPALGFVHDAHQAPLATPTMVMAALYPPMKPCDGSFGFHAAQAAYTAPQVVSWRREELHSNDLAAVFDDGPADIGDLPHDLHAELQLDLQQHAADDMGAGPVAQGLQHVSKQPCDSAGTEGPQHSTRNSNTSAVQPQHHTSFMGLHGAQPGEAAVGSEQQVQSSASMGGVPGSGAAAAGPSYKRGRGVGAEEEPVAAAPGAGMTAGRVLFHSRSRGRDLRMRLDPDNASLMSESSASLSELQSEDELNEAMAATALVASSSAPGQLMRALSWGANPLAPSASLPATPSVTKELGHGPDGLGHVYGTSAPAAGSGHPWLGSAHAVSSAGLAQGTGTSAAHNAEALSPQISDDAFLDGLLTNLGAAEDEDLLFRDFLSS